MEKTAFIGLCVIVVMSVLITYLRIFCLDCPSTVIVRTKPRHTTLPLSSIAMADLRKKMQVDGTRTCSCPEPSVGPLDSDTQRRQSIEYKEWKVHERKFEEPMTMCAAMSPIQYLGSGITVEPLKSVRLVGIEIKSMVNSDKKTVTLTSRYSLGYIYVEVFTNITSLQISGNNSHHIIIETDNIDDMNIALSHLIYQSTNFHIRQRDYIDVTVSDFHVFINVLIQRPHVPRLYDPGPGNDINKKVTVVAKTFERYECVKTLISSVKEFYPNMTILIADDSLKKENLAAKNVKHFMMPHLEGYAAGKNLLVSQVRTKYFLWVDDDFVFTEGTILERFVEKLESPTAELDLVAGSILKWVGTYEFSMFDYVNEHAGGCVFERKAEYGRVKEFPNCLLMDSVMNFFMAKTEAVRKVGFDLQFERIAHREFFIDALGHLRIAQCTDVSIRHTGSGKTKKYMGYRLMNNDKSQRAHYAEHVLFKNNLQCFQSWNAFFTEFNNNKRSK